MIGHYKDYESYEKALRHRLKSLIELYNRQKDYPFTARIPGFPKFVAEDKVALLNKIRELADCLHETNKLLREASKNKARYSKTMEL